MSVNSAGFSCELIAPYTLHELFSGENNVPVLEHAQQQLELLVCKLHVLFAHSHLVLGSVKNEICHYVLFSRSGACAACSSEDCLHTGEQLHYAERLCNVIVRTCFKAVYLVKLGGAGCEHYYGDICIHTCFQLAEYLEAVFSGKHYIKQDKGGDLSSQTFFKGLCLCK